MIIINKIVLNGDKIKSYDNIYIALHKQAESLLNTDLHPRFLMVFITEVLPTIPNLEIEWIKSNLSEESLDFKEKANMYKRVSKNAPTNKLPQIIYTINQANKSLGTTLFQDIINCFEKNNIRFELK